MYSIKDHSTNVVFGLFEDLDDAIAYVREWAAKGRFDLSVVSV